MAEMAFTDRLAHAWNAFRNRDRPEFPRDYGMGYSVRPDRFRPRITNERSIIEAIFNRIALDVSSVALLHARLDKNGRYVETVDSKLNYALTVEANIDQTGRAMIQDAVQSMCDEGCVAVVPVDTSSDPETGAFMVETLRVGKIVQWWPEYVRIRLYNQARGQHDEVVLPKRMVAIVENPMYSIMNEPNSIFQRLIRKMALLDSIDEQASSGKLDLIIQLPYSVRSEAKQKYAEKRRAEIEAQLANSKYGIAYADATEHITQLNRPLENNLLNQIEYLTNMVYSQLGITPEILNGTADEKTMLNYNNRVIEPILAAFADEFKRKFLTKTARAKMQSIVFIRDPFKLAPVTNIAEIADKFTRNAILSANEIRAMVGFKPVDDESADKLINNNLNHNPEEEGAAAVANMRDFQNGSDSGSEKPM